MSVVRAKADSPILIHAMSVIMVTDGVPMFLACLSLDIVGSLNGIFTMAGITAHLVACFPVTLKKHVRDQPASIIISVRSMAVVAIASIINRRSGE
jgi:hypothetical protein